MNSEQHTVANPDSLRQLLPHCLRRDQIWLQDQLRRVTAARNPHWAARQLARLLTQAESSAAAKQRRADRLPRLSYPPDLPVTARRAEIVNAIRAHQVIIVAGETGSGKTTQIPKMCLEAGLGLDGKVACTQPRRVAALSISKRLADELNVTWGQEIGCKIRFSDVSKRDSYIKVMTDGMLLAEVQSDPSLVEYDAIILDEAHERSLNIDFLLGYLQLLRQQRPELKLIITSATLDTEAFVHAFPDAPVIEVSGRLFPVETRYLPGGTGQDEDSDLTQVEAAVAALSNILIESSQGDVLIFMPTERDIRETCDLIRDQCGLLLDLIPLFGRLSAGDQQRAFQPSQFRKVIVATNIAETSLTIPGIRYVIDTGLARISRYNPRTRTKRLPVEPIAQSSAKQRMGRCGRVANGVCIRLYSEEDLLDRPAFAQPEIQRANLAEVILRMKAFRLGEIEEFPFINAPQPNAIKAGYDLLHELGALDADRRLTAVGRELARLPVDPAVGRMILQSAKEGVLEQVIVIAAGLSVQDPRERPSDAQSQADQAHRTFLNPHSDFLTLWNIWHEYHAQWDRLKTQNQVRKFCRAHFLSFSRMREWRDVYTQLREILKERKFLKPGAAHPVDLTDGVARAIHRSILTGLLTQIGERAERNLYQTPASRQISVFPGSGLFDRTVSKRKASASSGSTRESPVRQPRWIVAGEWVETARLYARTLAGIDPAWVVELGSHVCRRQHFEPHWDRKSGAVLAWEKTLMGALELQRKRIPCHRVAPQAAAEIFIREALVAEDLPPHYTFLKENHALRHRIATWQTRLRHHQLADLDERFFRFYSRRLGEVSSVARLNQFLKEHGEHSLTASESDLVGESIPFDPQAFPDAAKMGSAMVPLQYAYAPGEEHDGVTLRLPPSLAQALRPGALDQLVPGYLPDQVHELLRNLPKALRRDLMPLPPKVEQIVSSISSTDTPAPLPEQLSRTIHSLYGLKIDPGQWDLSALPNHLRPRVEVINSDNRVLVAGRNLSAIQTRLSQQAPPSNERMWQQAASQWERYSLPGWTFGSVPQQIEIGQINSLPVHAFPGLDLEQKEVHLRLFPSATKARQHTAQAAPALAAQELEREFAWLDKDLRAVAGLKPLFIPFGPADQLHAMAATHLHAHVLAPVREVYPLEEAAYRRALQEARERSKALVPPFLDLLKSILETRQRLAVKQPASSPVQPELQRLVPPDFLLQFSYDDLKHLPRFLKALEIRAERARLNPAKDREKMAQIDPYEARIQALEQAYPARPAPVRHLRRLLEEFRVSVFAQELGTAMPASAKRLDKQLEEAAQAGYRVQSANK